MVTLDWQLDRTGGVTLVELFVTSERDCRVEIESALQPVWPPRRQNRPVAGWTDSGFEGHVAAETGLVLGYASPAAPVEPPATIVGTEPAVEDSGTPTPEQLAQSLGEAAPPRDAIPAGAADRSASGTNGERSTPTDPTREKPDTAGSTSRAAARNTGSNDPQSRDTHPGEGSGARGSGPREGVATAGSELGAWLDGVERRLDVAEELAAVETAAEARTAVADAGGIEAVRELCAQLDEDREQLARLDATDIEGRLAAVDVPLSALERLA